MYSLMETTREFIAVQKSIPVAAFFQPGAYVRHPTEDWGLGQVQSVDGDRITCNFAHRGKTAINASVIALVSVDINNDTESAN